MLLYFRNPTYQKPVHIRLIAEEGIRPHLPISKGRVVVSPLSVDLWSISCNLRLLQFIFDSEETDKMIRIWHSRAQIRKGVLIRCLLIFFSNPLPLPFIPLRTRWLIRFVQLLFHSICLCNTDEIRKLILVYLNRRFRIVEWIRFRGQFVSDI